MLVPTHAVFREFEVVARLRANDERETCRICSVFIDHIERVDDVAQALAHLAALPVAYEPVEIHLLEGDLPCVEPRHQYHARDPEKEDVVAGLKHGGRVVRL